MTPAAHTGAVVCFGEVMLRLTAPAGELLLQTPRLVVSVGGAEANVAVSLARLGDAARMVTVLPEGPLGDAALGELRRWGVDTAGVVRGPGRMGLYFLTPGAVLRPSEVTYDRAHSAFAEADPAGIDWDPALAGAGWLHVSGVTPAIGANGAAAALRAVAAANRLGVPVSFDGNYRAKLWAAWGGDGPAILGELVAGAELAFLNEQDIGLILGARFEQADPAARRVAAMALAFERFPRLTRIAATTRVQHEVGRQDLAATLFTRDGGRLETRGYALSGIVDRIGAGDAFAAGLLHALNRDMDEQRALDFALAATVAKHGVYGDFNLATVADVEAILAGEGLDVRR